MNPFVHIRATKMEDDSLFGSEKVLQIKKNLCENISGDLRNFEIAPSILLETNCKSSAKATESG